MRKSSISLMSTVVIAFFAIQAGGAYGQACNGQYCQFNLGTYTVQNDEWGLSSDPSGGQKIWPNGSGWYASMTWNYTNGSVKAYPSIVAGWNFGGAWTPSPDGFPVKVNVNDPLPTSTSWYTTGTFTNYDVAYDVFFSPSSDPSSPSAELMVWIGGSGDTPAGSQIASNVTLGGMPGTWNVWSGNVGWPVYSFVRTQGVNSFSGNLQPFVYYLAYAHSYIPQSWFILDMQFGCEVRQASGEFFDKSFSGQAP
jgi:xyloglucan-specific endo-beta-1,4-glucanase